jgi:hypothetical protein
LILRLFKTNRIIKIPKAFLRISGLPYVKTTIPATTPIKEDSAFF